MQVVFIYLLRGFVIKYKSLEYAHVKTNILSHYYTMHRSFYFAFLKQLIDSLLIDASHNKTRHMH